MGADVGCDFSPPP
ncbi:hypothetical protein ZEAMMB73_Zm00001d009175 [Zea mays]|uniref:Uncharacterized protein n=1 Tax=Zea mays TaxID=4577 RepID=A0A1D6FI14_MAIZE|nr:hypothetical protein ZEAMMB73_Zm00001d009175 [Zea mays]